MITTLNKLAARCWLAVLLVFGCACSDLFAQDTDWPTVGVAAKITVILPGSELEGRPLFDDAEMVVLCRTLEATACLPSSWLDFGLRSCWG